MKKITVTVLLLAVLFTATSVTAQISNGSGKSRYGVKLGISLTNINLDGTDQKEWCHCPTFGAFYKQDINELLAIQGELLYERLGTRITDSTFIKEVFDYPNVVDSRLVFQYVSLPISLRLKANSWLSFEFGPKLSYCFSGRLNMTTFVESSDPDHSDYYVLDRKLMHDNQYQHWDLSGFVGADVLFVKHIGAGVRYSQGLLNVLKNTKMKSSTNSVFTVFLVYSL